jgi:hypothetical protein
MQSTWVRVHQIDAYGAVDMHVNEARENCKALEIEYRFGWRENGSRRIEDVCNNTIPDEQTAYLCGALRQNCTKISQ